MCGIVGAAAKRDIVPLLVEGLRRLEYRGYDSCGVAVLDGNGIDRVRSVERVADRGEARGIGAGDTGDELEVLGLFHGRRDRAARPARAPRDADPDHVSTSRLPTSPRGSAGPRA